MERLGGVFGAVSLLLLMSSKRRRRGGGNFKRLRQTHVLTSRRGARLEHDVRRRRRRRKIRIKHRDQQRADRARSGLETRVRREQEAARDAAGFGVDFDLVGTWRWRRW